MGLLRAGNRPSVTGKKAWRMFLECSLLGASFAPSKEYTKQDRSRITIMMESFNSMATDGEKVGKGQLSAGSPENKSP